MRRTVSTVAAAALAVGLLAGCTSVKASPRSKKPAASASVKAPKAAKSKAKHAGPDGPDGVARVVGVGREDSLTGDLGALVVHYEVTNVDTEVESFAVGVELVDAGGGVLGTMMAAAVAVEPGGTVADSAVVLPGQVRDGRVGDVVAARVVYVNDL